MGLLILTLGLSAMLSLTPRASGQDDARRPQLDAATLDAQESLRRDLLDTRLTAGLTLRQYLRQIGGSEALAGVLQKAGQRGGTRWYDEQTCEIRLELNGAYVAEFVKRLVADHPQAAGLTAESVRASIAELQQRVFTAVGISTGSGNLARIRPDPNNAAWRRISDPARIEALSIARRSAVTRVIDSLRSLDVGGKSMDEFLAAGGMAEALRAWLETRPVTGVEFDEGLEVRLTLGAAPDEIWDVVQKELLSRHALSETDGGAWDRLRFELSRQVSPAVGRAVATASAPASTAATRIVLTLPVRAPEWAGQQIDAVGVANGGGLRTARIAEQAALDQIRRQLESLPLNEQSTLGDMSRQDRRVGRILDDAVRQAATTKVEYLAGTVKVKVRLDVGRVWYALSSLN